MPFNRRFFLKALSLFSVAPTVAACGDDDDAETETGTGTETDTGNPGDTTDGTGMSGDTSGDTTDDTTGTDGTDGTDGADGTGGTDGPDNFPDYEWNGEPGPEAMFSHGVASGDPLSDAVILWTRISPTVIDGPTDSPVDVWFEVATDEAFEHRVVVDTAPIGYFEQYTFKRDITGLKPGTTYWYRFFAMGRASTVGRTRTLPAGNVDQVRFALCSCAKYSDGYFHAYGEIAKLEDIDAVVHVGDYIYESGAAGVRAMEPAHEIVTLDDYMARYDQYRRDPDLQAAHAAHPFIAVWDDHETANDSWKGGAEAHQPATEGDWNTRKMAGYTAYIHWMPIREQAPLKLWRSFEFGDLVSLSMLDTRIWGRDAQKVNGGNPDDPNRQILGADQEAWLFDRLKDVKGYWHVLGQQVPITPLEDSTEWGWEDDKWDEYEPARNRFFQAVRDSGRGNVVILTGDVHSSWALDTAPEPYDSAKYDPATGDGALAVEIVAPAICQGQSDTSVAYDFGLRRMKNSPHVKYQNEGANGFVVNTYTREKVHAEWWFISNVGKPEYTQRKGGEAVALTGTNRFSGTAYPLPA